MSNGARGSFPGPAPVPDAETRPFFEAAAEGRFLLKACRSCGEAHWYPRAICPFCHSAETEWRQSPGRGSIYSWTVMRRADPPYAIAFVTLEEGPVIMTNIVDADLDVLSIGEAVEMVLTPAGEGIALPQFRPLAKG